MKKECNEKSFLFAVLIVLLFLFLIYIISHIYISIGLCLFFVITELLAKKNKDKK